MELIRYGLGGVFLLAGVLIVFAGYVRQIANYKNRNQQDRRWSSPAPFIGPIFIVFGYFVLPGEFSSWIFLVIVLDPDTVVTLTSIFLLLKTRRQ